MTHLPSLLLGAFLTFLLVVPAQAALAEAAGPNVNDLCSSEELGVTQLSENKQDIIACLKADPENKDIKTKPYVWRGNGTMPNLVRIVISPENCSYSNPGGCMTSWTVPKNVKSAYVTVVGGGESGVGGFDGLASDAIPLISGGSGGYVQSYPLNLTPGEVIRIKIGAAAPGGQNYAAGTWSGNGVIGGTTTFGNYITCTGGGIAEDAQTPGACTLNSTGAPIGTGVPGQYITAQGGWVNGGYLPGGYGSGGRSGRCQGCVEGRQGSHNGATYVEHTASVGLAGSNGVVLIDALY